METMQMEKVKKLVPELRFKGFVKDWVKKKLGSVSDKIQDGTHFSPQIVENGDFMYVTSKNVKNGYMEFSNIQYISKEDHISIYKRCDIKKGDVLITKDGTIGQVCVNELDQQFSILSSVAFIRPNIDYSNYFIYQILVSPIGQKEIESQIAGQALKRITLTKINNFEYYFPSLHEQIKIASFLTAVDDKLQALKQKKTLLEQYKKGVMKQIFSQELRFKDDNGHEYSDWEEKMLGDIVKEYNVKSIVNDQYVVLSSSMGGIKLQSDYFTKDVSSKDNTGYKIVPKGYFTYRSMSDTGSFTFNIQNIVDIGIVSPAYPVFKTLDSIVSEYLSFYLNKSNKIINDLLGLKEGGTRYALSFSKFSRLEVILPSFQEQTKIANFLSTIDEKINHCQEQIVNTEMWKKGLLQQMFV